VPSNIRPRPVLNWRASVDEGGPRHGKQSEGDIDYLSEYTQAGIDGPVRKQGYVSGRDC
jgi:hypothetical protein